MSISLHQTPHQNGSRPWSVSELMDTARELLEDAFPMLWVEGELSNVARPSSGHLYFSLKDKRAQVRCALFRGRGRLLRFEPRDGMQVKLRARVSLYTVRGDFQLIVEDMEEAGAGDLRRAFEELCARLKAEGLFDPAAKRPLPPVPRRIGIITSESGAALQDILNVLKRRFPGLPILLYPVTVQGTDAAPQICRALAAAERRQDCDVLIVARGGGSLEDLQAFNDETVARAIFECSIPLVTGVGHETDFTVADLVADVRAPTPSAAAELVSPDSAEWMQQLALADRRLNRALNTRLRHLGQRLDWLERRLSPQSPRRRIELQKSRLSELKGSLRRAWKLNLQTRRGSCQSLAERLLAASPRFLIQQLKTANHTCRQRAQAAILRQLQKSGQRLAVAVRGLDTVSPLATLDRGYAIVSRERDGLVITAAQQTQPGEVLETKLAHGRLGCRVEKIIDTE